MPRSWWFTSLCKLYLWIPLLLFSLIKSAMTLNKLKCCILKSVLFQRDELAMKELARDDQSFCNLPMNYDFAKKVEIYGYYFYTCTCFLINKLNSIIIPYIISNVTPAFKKGKKSEPGNYRPISLTCGIGKMLEQNDCMTKLKSWLRWKMW